MKKIIITIGIVLTLTLSVPKAVKAQTEVLNLDDTLEAEKIKKEYSEYEETAEQVTIYLFRGEGCSHCHDFLEFLNTTTKENGYLFKLRSFEVYNNRDNLNVKNKIVRFFNDSASGVPYIVIGKETFYGFGKDDEEKILNAIKKEYESKKRYDVFDELEKERSSDENKKSENKKIYFILAGALILIVSTIIVLIKR